jgi:hypothetical protein
VFSEVCLAWGHLDFLISFQLTAFSTGGHPTCKLTARAPAGAASPSHDGSTSVVIGALSTMIGAPIIWTDHLCADWRHRMKSGAPGSGSELEIAAKLMQACPHSWNSHAGAEGLARSWLQHSLDPAAIIADHQVHPIGKTLEIDGDP